MISEREKKAFKKAIEYGDWNTFLNSPEALDYWDLDPEKRKGFKSAFFTQIYQPQLEAAFPNLPALYEKQKEEWVNQSDLSPEEIQHPLELALKQLGEIGKSAVETFIPGVHYKQPQWSIQEEQTRPEPTSPVYKPARWIAETLGGIPEDANVGQWGRALALTIPATIIGGAAKIPATMIPARLMPRALESKIGQLIVGELIPSATEGAVATGTFSAGMAPKGERTKAFIQAAPYGALFGAGMKGLGLGLKEAYGKIAGKPEIRPSTALKSMAELNKEAQALKEKISKMSTSELTQFLQQQIPIKPLEPTKPQPQLKPKLEPQDIGNLFEDTQPLIKEVLKQEPPPPPSLDPIEKIQQPVEISPTEPVKLPEKMPEELQIPHVKGKEVLSLGPNNEKIKMQYVLFDADKSKISYNPDTYVPNPNYPQEYQNRMRSRPALQLQVEKMKNNFEIRKVVSADTLEHGAPIIDRNGNVIAGNGRVGARISVSEEKNKEIAEYLKQHAQEFGFNPEDVDKFTKPMIGRVPIGDIDYLRLADISNIAEIAEFSTVERIYNNASKIQPQTLLKLKFGETTSIDTELLSQTNRPIVADIISQIGMGERFFNDKGQLTPEGLNELKGSIFYKVYGGNISKQLFDTTDINFKTFANALFETLPQSAELKMKIEAGFLPKQLDIFPEISKAIDVWTSLKNKGMDVDSYLAQREMFQSELSSFEKKILKDLSVYSNKKTIIKNIISRYIASADGAIKDPERLWDSAVQYAIGQQSYDLFTTADLRSAFEVDSPKTISEQIVPSEKKAEIKEWLSLSPTERFRQSLNTDKLSTQKWNQKPLDGKILYAKRHQFPLEIRVSKAGSEISIGKDEGITIIAENPITGEQVTRHYSYDDDMSGLLSSISTKPERGRPNKSSEEWLKDSVQATQKLYESCFDIASDPLEFAKNIGSLTKNSGKTDILDIYKLPKDWAAKIVNMRNQIFQLKQQAGIEASTIPDLKTAVYQLPQTPLSTQLSKILTAYEDTIMSVIDKIQSTAEEELSDSYAYDTVVEKTIRQNDGKPVFGVSEKMYERIQNKLDDEEGYIRSNMFVVPFSYLRRTFNWLTNSLSYIGRSFEGREIKSDTTGELTNIIPKAIQYILDIDAKYQNAGRKMAEYMDHIFGRSAPSNKPISDIDIEALYQLAGKYNPEDLKPHDIVELIKDRRAGGHLKPDGTYETEPYIITEDFLHRFRFFRSMTDYFKYALNIETDIEHYVPQQHAPVLYGLWDTKSNSWLNSVSLSLKDIKDMVALGLKTDPEKYKNIMIMPHSYDETVAYYGGFRARKTIKKMSQKIFENIKNNKFLQEVYGITPEELMGTDDVTNLWTTKILSTVSANPEASKFFGITKKEADDILRNRADVYYPQLKNLLKRRYSQFSYMMGDPHYMQLYPYNALRYLKNQELKSHFDPQSEEALITKLERIATLEPTLKPIIHRIHTAHEIAAGGLAVPDKAMFYILDHLVDKTNRAKIFKILNSMRSIVAEGTLGWRPSTAFVVFTQPLINMHAEYGLFTAIRAYNTDLPLYLRGDPELRNIVKEALNIDGLVNPEWVLGYSPKNKLSLIYPTFLFNEAQEAAHVVTALGTYRHAKNLGIVDKNQIIDLIRRNDRKLVHAYSDVNLPPLLSGHFGRTIGLFKPFTVNITELGLDYAKNFFKEPKQFIRFIAGMGLRGGMMGVRAVSPILFATFLLDRIEHLLHSTGNENATLFHYYDFPNRFINFVDTLHKQNKLSDDEYDFLVSGWPGLLMGVDISRHHNLTISSIMDAWIPGGAELVPKGEDPYYSKPPIVYDFFANLKKTILGLYADKSILAQMKPKEGIHFDLNTVNYYMNVLPDYIETRPAGVFSKSIPSFRAFEQYIAQKTATSPQYQRIRELRHPGETPLSTLLQFRRPESAVELTQLESRKTALQRERELMAEAHTFYNLLMTARAKGQKDIANVYEQRLKDLIKNIIAIRVEAGGKPGNVIQELKNWSLNELRANKRTLINNVPNTIGGSK
ncbi:MAG: hypothetical protein ACP5JP_02280 [bacterium]